MTLTLNIIEPEEVTQYPYMMAKESKTHGLVSKIFPKPKKFDYFVTFGSSEYPNLKTATCGYSENVQVSEEDRVSEESRVSEEEKDGSTLCPSDHVPIYMDYTFEEVNIRIISWNIQYFLSNQENNISRDQLNQQGQSKLRNLPRSRRRRV